MNRRIVSLFLGQAVCLLGALSGCEVIVHAGEHKFARPSDPRAVECKVIREECKTMQGGICAEYYPARAFEAHVCAEKKGGGTEKAEEACQRLCDNDSEYHRQCNVEDAKWADVAQIGVCVSDTQSEYRAKVDYTPRFYYCADASCAVTTIVRGTRLSQCWDVSARGAIPLLNPATNRYSGWPEEAVHTEMVFNTSLEINGIALNVESCGRSSIGAPLGDPSDLSSWDPSGSGLGPSVRSLAEAPGVDAFALAAVPPTGKIGTLSFGGTSVDLIVIQGYQTVGRLCPTCALQLKRLMIKLADIAFGGQRLTNLMVENIQPVDLEVVSGHQVIQPHAMGLRVTGELNGLPMEVGVVNETQWSAETSGGGLHLAGAIDLTTNSGGAAVPVTAAIDVAASPATARQKACITMGYAQRMFGFEDRWMWTSDQAALSQATTGVTEGCGALGVSGQGYMTLTGPAFSTVGLDVKSALGVDLFIPSNQPNPYWIGALQSYLTCPSAGIYNLYVGQRELTGLPLDTYSTLRYSLPPAAQTALSRPLRDCSFSFALNVNATGRTWKLDNLRFVP